jgi:UDP-glucose 4-epimerase
MKNNILLIGGAGFLGSNLASVFRRNGWNVGLLDRVPLTDPAHKVEQFIGELRDMHLLRQALKKFRRVVFLAHETRVAPAADRLPANFLANIELLLLVLEEARECGVDDFVLLSSGGAVYGEAKNLPIREDHPKHPRSPYGVAKLTMEKYLAMMAELGGFRQLAIRPSNPYGPGQNFHATQGLVAVAMARIARGEPIAIRGDGSAVKDYIFIDDFSDACFRLISHQEATGPYNLGSGRGTRLLDAISEIEKVVGKKAVLRFEAAQVGDVKANVLDILKIHEATGWKPSTPFGAGIAKTWDWMKRQFPTSHEEKPKAERGKLKAET